MVQLKYAWKELVKKPGRYLPLYIQIIVSILLFSFIVKEFYTMNQFSSRLMSYTEHKNIYISNLQSDVVKLMNELSSETGESRCKELYNFTLQRGTVYIQMPVTIRVSPKIEEHILAVNDGFCNLYEMKIKEGRMFSKQELDGILQDDIVPVLVGEEKAKTYPIGTVFESITEDKITFEVIGVIDNQSFYLNPAIQRGVSYFTEEMVMPWLPEKRINGMNGGYNDVNLYNLLQIETSETEVLEEIVEKSKELNLFELSFISYEERIGELDYYYNLMYQREFAMLGAILLYCIIGSITMLLQYIRSNIRQFSIHILCGARKNDMIIRMFVQIGIPVVVAIISVGLIFKNILSLFAGIGFGIGMLLLIMIIPIQFWKRVQISQILKRYD